ncbi:MarR family transcriptional regulator [Planococcus sp. ISL-109]|uniref:MarR family winged helix-turn-helix transcriptional regulator n=1 Tax=Planococcus sp. ISL-109 TaxID=2819166 RepID=UPI001BE9E155|nr:MarR family transcriptional regulator [Planococcus sp. ISL-109]MBT2581340.1 MarR family transcriptional regulator [Planococcus sp. ISL-109]
MELLNQNLKAVTVLIRAADAVHDAIKRDVADYGLNATEFSVLELLYHQGRQPIQAIGKKVLIASSSITYVVDKLMHKGYVEREACKEDRRVTYALLTEDGHNVMDRIFPEHELQMNKVFAGLTEEEVAELIRTLKKVGYEAQESDGVEKAKKRSGMHE